MDPLPPALQLSDACPHSFFLVLTSAAFCSLPFSFRGVPFSFPLERRFLCPIFFPSLLSAEISPRFPLFSHTSIYSAPRLPFFFPNSSTDQDGELFFSGSPFQGTSHSHVFSVRPRPHSALVSFPVFIVRSPGITA